MKKARAAEENSLVRRLKPQRRSAPKEAAARQVSAAIKKAAGEGRRSRTSFPARPSRASRRRRSFRPASRSDHRQSGHQAHDQSQPGQGEASAAAAAARDGLAHSSGCRKEDAETRHTRASEFDPKARRSAAASTLPYSRISDHLLKPIWVSARQIKRSISTFGDVDIQIRPGARPGNAADRRRRAAGGADRRGRVEEQAEAAWHRRIDSEFSRTTDPGAHVHTRDGFSQVARRRESRSPSASRTACAT